MVLALRRVFCPDLSIERGFCFIHHKLISFYNRGVKCLQRGTADSLYKAYYVWSLNNRGGKCLQRGTD